MSCRSSGVAGVQEVGISVSASVGAICRCHGRAPMGVNLGNAELIARKSRNRKG